MTRRKCRKGYRSGFIRIRGRRFAYQDFQDDSEDHYLKQKRFADDDEFTINVDRLPDLFSGIITYCSLQGQLCDHRLWF